MIAVAVFGSFARETAKFPGSDIAILMVVEDKLVIDQLKNFSVKIYEHQ